MLLISSITQFCEKAIFMVGVFSFSCSHLREQPAEIKTDVVSGELFSLDSALLSRTALISRKSVEYFYSARHLMPFWVDRAGFKPAADSLIAVIRQAGRFGLISADYHDVDIKELLEESLPSAITRIELLLTDSYLTLFRHIRSGRVDPKTLRRVDLSSAPDREAIASLQNIVDGAVANQLRSVEPLAPQYRQLKVALQAFWPTGREDPIHQERAQKISLNMERWRWQLPWPERYVMINIPAFQMRVVENDSVWLESKVIVGKRETSTPVMESVIRSFTIYPYWHVPASISTKEILPQLQDNPLYLARNNFEVLNKAGMLIVSDTIRWRLYGPGYFPFILRQREGSENSMGVIKFNFRNPYGVFLHDTNSKRLFRVAKRDFSHGCVRVDNAVALAHYLVREDDIYVSPEDLDQYLSLQHRLEIRLRNPIILKLEYFTCEVRDGTTFFYDDIYRKDSLMTEALHDLSLLQQAHSGPQSVPVRDMGAASAEVPSSRQRISSMETSK